MSAKKTAAVLISFFVRGGTASLISFGRSALAKQGLRRKRRGK
jgi:hypothetical protein